MPEKSILILEERHMISIMLRLYEDDGCTKTALYRAVSNNPRMPDKLDALERSGLIRQERSTENRAVRLYLTDIGRKVGEGLIGIERAMSE